VDLAIHWLPSAMTEFAISGGVDHLNTVGKVAPGLFAQEGRCWRMVYENPVGHPTFCMEPVVGRTVEVQEGLDEGVVVRAALRRVAMG
jgi:hypothetical protein